MVTQVADWKAEGKAQAESKGESRSEDKHESKGTAESKVSLDDSSIVKTVMVFLNRNDIDGACRSPSLPRLTPL
jgi:hypothetical protein